LTASCFTIFDHRPSKDRALVTPKAAQSSGSAAGEVVVGTQAVERPSQNRMVSLLDSLNDSVDSPLRRDQVVPAKRDEAR
jgi:hypothetical protein